MSDKNVLGPVQGAPIGDVRDLDGDPDDMFPLLTAADVGEKIGFSSAYVHQLWQLGELPYVLWPVGRHGRGAVSHEPRRRRMRSDHLRQAVQRFAVEAKEPG